MLNKISADHFESLLLEATQWIDVRAPIEFVTGAVPGAINLPLLSNDERHVVGLTYKEQGQQSAVELGHSLVSGVVREERLHQWLKAIRANPQSIIYCFRGGLRSQIVQKWLAEQSVHVSLVEGGYKNLRRFFLEVLATRVEALEFCVVSGPTGSGKTAFLHSSGKPFLDLEAIACHRGSVFGKTSTPQPHPANFENALALQVLQLSSVKGPILIESESRLIGHRYLPDAIYNKILTSPKHTLEVSIDERVQNILQDYVLAVNNIAEQFEEFRKCVKSIGRKLGSERSSEILKDIHFSEEEYLAHRGLESNTVWIRKLLLWYYDPLYKKVFTPSPDTL